METRHGRKGCVQRGGVTLVELMVAVSIIVLLTGLSYFCLVAGHRAAEGVTNRVGAANPKAASKRRSAVPMQPSLPIPNQYLVVFKPSVTQPQAAANQLAKSVPASILHVYKHAIKGCALRIQPGQLSTLQAHPSVAYVAQDQTRSIGVTMPTGISRVRYVNAPRTPQYKLVFPQPRQVTAPRSYAGSGLFNLPKQSSTFGGTTTPIIKAVVVIDSGIDPTHPELNVVYSAGFGAGVPQSGDDFGHGTHVAGIVGVRGVKIVGMYPGVPLWSLRVFPPSPPGQEPTAADADIIAALDYVTKNASQVGVVNMSLGGKGIDAVLNAAVTSCVNAGVVCCVAAGNDNADATDYCPASAPGAICVAALCDSDGLPGGHGPAGSFGDPDDTMTSFSNFGGVVAVMAPGEDILSTYPVALGSYAVLSGTSMATPNCAGMCSLVLANYSYTTVTGTTTGTSAGGTPTVPLINLPSRTTFSSTGTSTSPGRPTIAGPADVLAWLRTESVEQIPGLAANNDARRYTLITGRP